VQLSRKEVSKITLHPQASWSSNGNVWSQTCMWNACIAASLQSHAWPAALQSTCKVCPAGHWSPRGVTSCTPCAAGTFTAEANSTSCTLAPKNTFTNATGATAATVSAAARPATGSQTMSREHVCLTWTLFVKLLLVHCLGPKVFAAEILPPVSAPVADA
jgi:hypothetical protein